MRVCFFLYISLVFVPCFFGQNENFPFVGNWRLKEFNNGKRLGKDWIDAIVPGNVHNDLQRSGRIADTFIAENSSDLQWIEQSDWVYETIPFEVDQKIYSKEDISLRFNGIDTYARIILNDVEILIANNAHRSWEVNVKDVLRSKGNVLRIIFSSAIQRAHKELQISDGKLPGDSVRAMVRKPQFHFGWDFAPRLVSVGITKSIEWVAYDKAVLCNHYIDQKSVSEELANLTFSFTGRAITSGSLQVEVECLYNHQRWSSSSLIHDSSWSVKMDAQIAYPSLWWCNGLGNPNMTEFRYKLMFDGDVIFDDVIRVGIRSVKLVKENLSAGESFGFELNGIPVFVKGANYIPVHHYINDSKFDDYKDLLSRCHASHFNMLRVWGGGYYESDSFYDLCDEYGIMVWHDFMFACTMYPYDDSFIQNVRAEAIEQVTRLRNHPCMALWCGNNEVSEGWNRWGWKNDLSPSEMRVLDKGYQEIFLELLPSIVADNSNTPYHHSSPLFGRGDSRSFSEGDMHDWGIWHDEIPMEDWGVRVPRFMSEFGVQSYPSEKVLRMMSAENFSESDSSFLRHQGHPRGFRLMHDYAERWYRGCSSLDSRKYGYITQAVQAEGMVNAINVHRIRQPYCMGTMFWQLNDIWPSFSWSAIDFASNEKLLFQMLQEAYAPQTVIALLEHDSVKVFWVSDRVCDRDSAKLFLKWNTPGESLDVFPDVRDFKGDPGISCHVNMGVSLLYAESVAAIFRNEMRDLCDWTLDCSIRIAGQEDFSVVRKFRLLPGSKGWIVPDIIENSVEGKGAGVRYRRQVFRRL